MIINIGHLYYDLFNLYGSSGNIKAMKSYLEEQGIKVNIKFITLNDDINLDDIDILFIGSGTEHNQDLVLKHINKYKKEFENFINSDKYLLASGNSLELFGKSINNKEALGIFPFNSTRTDFRIVDEAYFKCNLIDKPILGFQNQGSVIKDINENNLFTVIKGTGNYPKSKVEGYHYKNFYGTYLIGPLLVRNPSLLEYLMNNLIYTKDRDFKIKKNILEIEEKAFQNFIELHYNNI